MLDTPGHARAPALGGGRAGSRARSPTSTSSRSTCRFSDCSHESEPGLRGARRRRPRPARELAQAPARAAAPRAEAGRPSPLGGAQGMEAVHEEHAQIGLVSRPQKSLSEAALDRPPPVRQKSVPRLWMDRARISIIRWTWISFVPSPSCGGPGSSSPPHDRLRPTARSPQPRAGSAWTRPSRPRPRRASAPAAATSSSPGSTSCRRSTASTPGSARSGCSGSAASGS